MDCGCTPADVLLAGMVGGLMAIVAAVAIVVALAGGPTPFKGWWK